MLRDIAKGEDEEIVAVIDLLIAADADILTLQGFDYDLEGRALRAFIATLAAGGLTYPHYFAGPPNAGLSTSLDLDGDGRIGEAADAQGYGRFYGAGSMAVLSKHPIVAEGIRDYSSLLWLDLPGATLPVTDAGPFPSKAAQEIQRLSSHSHWTLPIEHPVFGPVTLMTFHAGPPVFDGPEDRNGLRNHDEVAFWSRLLDGDLGPAPTGPFILTGDANLDPDRGDGRGIAMRRLLDHPALQDPLPNQATVAWPQTGPMRVDYILPSADWTVSAAEVMPQNPRASRHHLVWVDLTR